MVIKLDPETRTRCVILMEQGLSQREVAKSVGCSKWAVQLTWKRYQATGSVKDLPRSGARRKSTPRDDRSLVRMSLADRKLTAPELRAKWEDAGVTLSTPTVKRRLQQAGLNGRVARKKPLLTQKHKKNRLQFCQDHRDWTVQDWERVIFTDESKFNLVNSDGVTYIRRRPGEELLEQCVVPTVKFGGGSVMVWGAMCYRGVGYLEDVSGRLDAEGYIDILGNSMVPSAHLHFFGDTYVLQDDNAPCHRAKKVRDWLLDQGIQRLTWPAQSPDLNPIENLWGDIKRQLKRNPPRHLRDLSATIHALWESISPDRCRDLVESMPNRIQTCIKAKGGYTKY